MGTLILKVGRSQSLGAPPRPTAVVADVGEASGVLLVGGEPPAALICALHRAGWRVDRAADLVQACALLAACRYRLLVADASVGGGRVVDWAVAVRAGDAAASGVPLPASRLPILLVAPDPDEGGVALTAARTFEVAAADLGRAALGLLTAGRTRG